MNPLQSFFVFLIFQIFLLSCTRVTESVQEAASVNTTQSPLSTCEEMGYYSLLTTCQNTNHVTCTSEVINFDDGSVGYCFSPPEGYEECLTTPATWSWIYTQWGSWCKNQTVALAFINYERRRSVIGCSHAICRCEEAQTISATCTDASTCSAEASVQLPNPMTAMPTPVPCQ